MLPVLDINRRQIYNTNEYVSSTSENRLPPVVDEVSVNVVMQVNAHILLNVEDPEGWLYLRHRLSEAGGVCHESGKPDIPLLML